MNQPPPPPRRLYDQAEVCDVLQLETEQIDWLVKTRQLSALRICGQIRFDSRDVNELIETYKQTSTRKFS